MIRKKREKMIRKKEEEWKPENRRDDNEARYLKALHGGHRRRKNITSLRRITPKLKTYFFKTPGRRS